MLQPNEKNAINSICALIGRSPKETRDFFESAGILAVINLLKENSIVIPYIGKVDLSFKDTEVFNMPKVKAEFEPSPFLIKNMQQISNKETTEAERILISRFYSVFKQHLNN